MCLAVPGQIVSIDETSRLHRTGMVSFEGVLRRVNLACVPDCATGDFVLVHAGVAIGRIDAVEADRTLDLITQMLNRPPGEAS